MFDLLECPHAAIRVRAMQGIGAMCTRTSSLMRKVVGVITHTLLCRLSACVDWTSNANICSVTATPRLLSNKGCWRLDSNRQAEAFKQLHRPWTCPRTALHQQEHTAESTTVSAADAEAASACVWPLPRAHLQPRQLQPQLTSGRQARAVQPGPMPAGFAVPRKTQ